LIQISNVNDVSLRTVAVRGSARATKDIWRDDPFVTRLRNFVDLTLPDLQSLRAVIEVEQSVKKRRDLVHDGYEYCKLCFVKDGFAARYKLLRNGKRQIVDFVLPGDVVGLPGSFLDRAAHSVLAVSDMKLQVCSLEAFVALCFRRPKFGLALSWLAAQEAVNYAERKSTSAGARRSNGSPICSSKSIRGSRWWAAPRRRCSTCRSRRR